MHYLETGSLDPAYNLAFEEVVLNSRRQGEYLLLWQNDRTVVVGQNQNTLEEVSHEAAEANGVRVVRRITGGGAVYHDLGNLNYSFITDAGEAEEMTAERFAAPVVAALRALGLRAEVSGRNDILVDGRKVSGTARCLRNGRILYHGTLLFDSDLEMVAEVLRVDPEKFRSKSSKSVRSRVGNIRPCLKEDMDLPAFRDYLRRCFAAEADCLTVEELAEVQRLKAEKYDTWAWTYGHSPAYETTNRRRFGGGSLTVSVTVNRGTLEGISFRGDFLSLKDPADIERALAGRIFTRESVLAVLREYHLPEYFGTITEEELLQTIF